MKRIYSIIALIAAVTMFTACGSDDASYKATPVLEVTAADVLFEAEGGDGSIVLNTNSEVAAATDANWLTLNVEGNKVIVTANPNLSLEGRNAVIKLRAGSTEAEVTATQKSSIYGVPTLEYEVGDYQASVDIPVVHSQDVNVESQSDWIEAVFNEETNEIEIIAQDNDDIDPREGTVKLTMGSYTDIITVKQAGFLCKVAEDKVLVKKNAAETQTVDVEHSRAVTATSEAEWITASFDEENNQVVIETEENTGVARAGYVTITSGPVTETITVIQYDFATEVTEGLTNGYYYLGYMDLNGKRRSVPAMLYQGMFVFMIGNNIYYTGIDIDEENETISVGPCGKPIGVGQDADGNTIYTYLFWFSLQGYFSGYNDTTTMATGTLEIEESEGDIYVMINFGGTFAKGFFDIDLWLLEKMSANELSAEYDTGDGDYLIYPYLIKVGGPSGIKQKVKRHGETMYITPKTIDPSQLK